MLNVPAAYTGPRHLHLFFVHKMNMTAPSMFSIPQKINCHEAKVLYLGYENDLFLAVSLSRLIILCMA